MGGYMQRGNRVSYVEIVFGRLRNQTDQVLPIRKTRAHPSFPLGSDLQRAMKEIFGQWSVRESHDVGVYPEQCEGDQNSAGALDLVLAGGELTRLQAGDSW